MNRKDGQMHKEESKKASGASLGVRWASGLEEIHFLDSNLIWLLTVGRGETDYNGFAYA